MRFCCTYGGSFLTLVLIGTVTVRAAVLLSDFSSINPLDPAGRSTGSWHTNAVGVFEPQIHSFTLNGIFGQEVSPAGSGNPNVSDSSGVSSLALDLGGETHLALTARLLPQNQALEIIIALADSAGVGYYWTFPTSAFNQNSFETYRLSFEQGQYSYGPGGNPQADQLNFAQIESFGVAGNFYDIGSDSQNGSARFHIQFDALAAVPEPAPMTFAAGAGLAIWAALRRCLRSPRK